MKIKLEPRYQANIRVSGNTVKGQFAYITINDKKYKISRCVSHKGKFNDEKMYMLFTLEDANAFYEALGLTPPEEVNENTTGGRTR